MYRYLHDDDLELYEDSPVSPGKLAGMTLAELEHELRRQCDRLDDAQHIDDRAVGETGMHCGLAAAQTTRREPAQ